MRAKSSISRSSASDTIPLNTSSSTTGKCMTLHSSMTVNARDTGSVNARTGRSMVRILWARMAYFRGAYQR